MTASKPITTRVSWPVFPQGHPLREQYDDLQYLWVHIERVAHWDDEVSRWAIKSGDGIYWNHAQRKWDWYPHPRDLTDDHMLSYEEAFQAVHHAIRREQQQVTRRITSQEVTQS